MIFFKSEKVLLVAPNIFSVELMADNKQIRHITSIDRVFPTIFEMQPTIIVFDYDYLSEDMEHILRRIRQNSFYKRIKICCFKSSPNSRTDSFLQMLGVNHVIYKNELQNQTETAINQVKSIFDNAVTNLLVNASLENMKVLKIEH
ncbi:MAG: hypothetical protein JWQ63_2040 [Mucilaginibacter sp.]|jgi:hypothetical protein|nr:hypothetical protein [Mucilaginibacter sp.]